MYFSNYVSLITFVVLCFCTSHALFYTGVQQRVSAKGRLLCGTQPAVNVLVKLVDKDRGMPDDELSRTTTNARGEFYLNGTHTEVGNIDPYLKIFHDCNDAGVPCQRKTKLIIPESYISKVNDTGPRKTVDIGAINLEIDVRKEKRDCSP